MRLFDYLRDKAIPTARAWFGSLSPFWRGFLCGLALLMLVVTLTGCSGAASHIAQDAGRARAAASSIDALSDEIRALAQTGAAQTGDTTAQAYFAEIEGRASSVKSNAAVVASLADRVAVNVTKVKDITPWWGEVIRYVAGAGLAVALIFALWRLGVLTFIRGWLGALSPAVRSDAKLSLEALNLIRQSDDPQAINAQESALAARRAADPAFDRAFRSLKA